MFCPKCGDKLKEKSGGFLCEAGDMPLSLHLVKRFFECFVTRAEKPRDLRFSFLVGGEWFCPGCGVKTTEQSGVVFCPECGLSLNEFIHALIELHPHR